MTVFQRYISDLLLYLSIKTNSPQTLTSWMQVWPGLWEYLRLALPCVAMVAVEWWSFDPQINIYRMIKFFKEFLDQHNILWHFGWCWWGTAGSYGRLFPFTRNLSAQFLGIFSFRNIQRISSCFVFLKRWGDQDQLAAHVTAANVSAILYLSGSGAQKATSALVGGRNTRQKLTGIMDIYIYILYI